MMGLTKGNSRARGVFSFLHVREMAGGQWLGLLHVSREASTAAWIGQEERLGQVSKGFDGQGSGSGCTSRKESTMTLVMNDDQGDQGGDDRASKSLSFFFSLVCVCVFSIVEKERERPTPLPLFLQRIKVQLFALSLPKLGFSDADNCCLELGF